MTTWFVTRHPGAVEWAQASGIEVDRQVDHLDIRQVGSGDIVLGILPVHLAAAVCACGARYFHLGLAVPLEHRGRELTVADMARFGACLEEFIVDRRRSAC